MSAPSKDWLEGGCIFYQLSEGFWCSQEAKGFQQPNICIPAFNTKIHTVDKKGPKTFSVVDWFCFGSNKKHQVTLQLTGSSTGILRPNI